MEFFVKVYENPKKSLFKKLTETPNYTASTAIQNIGTLMKLLRGSELPVLVIKRPDSSSVKQTRPEEDESLNNSYLLQKEDNDLTRIFR